MRTYILGSSHISRLNTFVSKNFDLRLDNHFIKIQGHSGGFVNDMYKYITDIYDFGPDLVFLQIVSNDIGQWQNSVDNVVLAVEYLVDN